MSERRRIDDLYEQFDDARHYDVPGHGCDSKTTKAALDAVETLLALAAAGKLDAVDLRIIEERSRSPMPTLREVAATIGCGVATVFDRAERIKTLVCNNMRKKQTISPNKR